MSWNGISLVARAALAAVVFGVGVGMTPVWAGSPDFMGAQLDLAYPGNTHNNDNHEASSELMTGGELFVGWDLAPWAAVQANLTLMRQFLHGYNHGSTRESDTGDRYAIAAMACPVFRVPGLIVTPYVSGCVGPAYERIDGGPSSVTGTRTDEHNIELALRGAFGIERQIYGRWSLRLEGAYMRVGVTDAMDQFGAGAAFVFRFKDPQVMPPDTGRMRMSSGEVAAHHETSGHHRATPLPSRGRVLGGALIHAAPGTA